MPGDDWARKHARTGDPATSHAAAEQVATVESLCARLEAVYQDAAPEGLTSEEACDAAGLTAEDGGWRRVSDLLRLGVIEDTGTTRLASTGRAQRVHVWIAPGERVPETERIEW